jgi:hypothetical protein
MMEKLEAAGASKPVVGLVIPAGYSFNLDGTAIYVTMGAIFLAQATNTPMSATQQLALLGLAMLMSKGAAGVTGSGLVILISTLETFKDIPVAAIALILGIDRHVGGARAHERDRQRRRDARRGALVQGSGSRQARRRARGSEAAGIAVAAGRAAIVRVLGLHLTAAARAGGRQIAGRLGRRVVARLRLARHRVRRDRGDRRKVAGRQRTAWESLHTVTYHGRLTTR